MPRFVSQRPTTPGKDLRYGEGYRVRPCGPTPGGKEIPTQLIDNQTPVERAVLVSAPHRSINPELAHEHLEELRRLTDTAGGEVVAEVRQRIDSPNSSTFIGKGKVEEVANAVALAGADLVIFDEELSPRQGSNLEKAAGVRVMDRAELILDIFATRARTREARLQVELAQLEYLLPRLTRMWTHLSRIRGGIGLRGPGETQLETDRRLIRTRIADLRSKLEDVAEARATRRKTRTGSYRAALVGYTNAGKSSVLNGLSGADLFVEDRLFATLDSTTRSVDVGDGYSALVTDTVGFIRKLPHHLVASFRSTLEEAREADILLLVMDAAHPDRDEHLNVVREVLHELDLSDRPQALVFNQIDRLEPDELDALRARVRAFEPFPSIFTSAVSPEGLQPLRDHLLAGAKARFEAVDVDLPVADGRTLAWLYRDGEVIERTDTDDTVTVRVRAPAAVIGRLEQTAGVRVRRKSGRSKSESGGTL